MNRVLHFVRRLRIPHSEMKKYFCFGICWAFILPVKWGFTPRGWFASRQCINWKRCKKDIVYRANWLCEKVIVEPKTLLASMPQFLGNHYCCEWAIYSCSMLVASLMNISRIYPEEKKDNLSRMAKLIDIILSPEIRSYDTNSWNEDALRSLSGDKSHMTYLSILAWTITNYKMTGGDNRFDTLLDECCEALHRRMLKSHDLNLQSFPLPVIFFPDMLVTIVALKNYSILNKGRYGETVQSWIRKARHEWMDEKTGLLQAYLYYGNNRRKKQNVRGSYSALSCYYLTLIDKEFAEEQYEKMKTALLQSRPVTGIREYIDKTPYLSFDVDAGPIALGLSPSGTAFAIGSATFFNDFKLRTRLLRSGEIVGQTVFGRNKRHYRLGELVIVGESVVLAMKTNIQSE